MAVNGISGISGIDFLSSLSKTGFSSIDKTGFSNIDKTDTIEGSFANYLKDAIIKASDLEKQSTALTEAFAAGDNDNIHQVLIAADKAEVALQFTMQIRNKIMEAYNEIMNMQI